MPARNARSCPICGRPAIAEDRPFCSRRCVDVDLNRWLSGRYFIPASEEAPGRQDEEPDARRDDERH